MLLTESVGKILNIFPQNIKNNNYLNKTLDAHSL